MHTRSHLNRCQRRLGVASQEAWMFSEPGRRSHIVTGKLSQPQGASGWRVAGAAGCQRPPPTSRPPALPPPSAAGASGQRPATPPRMRSLPGRLCSLGPSFSSGIRPLRPATQFFAAFERRCAGSASPGESGAAAFAASGKLTRIARTCAKVAKPDR